MRLNRFINTFDLSQDSLFLAGEQARQIQRVLRLKTGENIILSDGAGQEAVARIESFEKEGIRISIIERQENKNEPSCRATLYCALLKKEKFEWVAEHATEIGIKEIVPVSSGRVVKNDVRLERLAKIVREASEQSGRGILPAVRPPVLFKGAVVESLEKNEDTIFLSLSGTAGRRMKKALKRGVFVGPEGGWTAEEEAYARQKGCSFVSLGPLTLRAETAAIIGSYLAVQQ